MKRHYFLMGLAILFGCKGNDVNPNKGKPLPVFSLQRIDSTTISPITSEKTPVVLFVFDPDCMYCQAELKTITEHNELLTAAKIYMITYVSYPKMIEFYKKYKIYNYKNIVLGRDTAMYTLKYFNLTGVPFTAVYSKEHLLNRTFDGKTGASIIFNSL